MAGACLLTVVLTALPAGALRPTDEELVASAEAAFQEGVQLRESDPAASRQAFLQAAQAYHQLHDRGYRNPDLYRNEGAAWLLAGKQAPAILAFRRGLLLAPDDLLLQRHLASARGRVVYASKDGFGRPPESSWPPWPTLLGVAAIALSALACITLTLAWMRGSRSLFVTGILLFVLTALPAGLYAYDEWHRWQEQQQPLVVIAEEGVLLYKGNGSTYPRYEQPLHAGVEARLLFERGNWVQIELGGGEVGWVNRDYVLIDR